MTDAEYMSTQQLLISAAQMVDLLDLDEFRARISHCEAVWSIVDPTLYRDAHRNLRAIDELAAGIRLKGALQTLKHQARVAEREVDP
jgi:hypothetical protein